MRLLALALAFSETGPVTEETAKSISDALRSISLHLSDNGTTIAIGLGLIVCLLIMIAIALFKILVALENLTELPKEEAGNDPTESAG